MPLTNETAFVVRQLAAEIDRIDDNTNESDGIATTYYNEGQRHGLRLALAAIVGTTASRSIDDLIIAARSERNMIGFKR